jgi:hypothetical protein
MIRKELFNQIGLFLWEGFVIWVSAENVFEERFYLVDIVVFLTSEFELLDFFVSSDSTFFLGFLFFVMIFSEIVDNTIVVVAVFFPELIEVFSFSFLNF